MGIADSSTRTGARRFASAPERAWTVPGRGICATLEPNMQRALTAVPDAAF